MDRESCKIVEVLNSRKVVTGLPHFEICNKIQNLGILIHLASGFTLIYYGGL